MDVAEKVDRQKPNRNLIRLDHAIDVDDRRESHAAAPEWLQFQKQRFVESGVGCDLIIGATGNGIDRFAERAQRALIRKRDRNHDGDPHADAEDRQQRPHRFARDGTQHERADHHQRLTLPSAM